VELTTDEPSNKPPHSATKPEAVFLFVQRRVTDDQVCVLTFDRPDSSANVFDRATIEELNDQLDFIAGSPKLKGVVLTSAKPSIFIAGADLHSLAGAPAGDLASLIELGQNVFNRLAALPVPTVAAIHGACVGGGYEICLACDARIASPDKATKIGLPETQLGILPAWGGCLRLPRLIGVPKALDIILAGKTLAAKPALKCGMIDDIVPREYLVEKARKLILSRGLGLRRRKSGFVKSLVNTGLVARIIAGRVEKTLFKKTR